MSCFLFVNFYILDKRQAMQEKTFKKWINVVLASTGMQIDDIYSDLKDGRVLVLLLEILSGDSICEDKPERNSKIQWMEMNLKALKYLRDNFVKVDNIGPSDIVEGNKTLILGLIWIIVLRYQISPVVFGDSALEGQKNLQGSPYQEFRSLHAVRTSLLLWCQMHTAYYDNIEVVDFGESWRNGLAFNALAHKFMPSKVDYDCLGTENPRENLNTAFRIFKEECGIDSLLDAEGNSSFCSGETLKINSN